MAKDLNFKIENDINWKYHYHTQDYVTPRTSDSNAMDVDNPMPPQPCRKRGSKKLTSLKHTSKYTNNKLIKILFEQGLVSLQCWSIDQILTTLTTYRNDPKLRTAYQWF